MKGATAEPWASTSRPPRSTLMKMIGSIQYLRRAPRKRHICSTKSICHSLLEHVAEAVVRRPRRIAPHPIARLRGLEAPAHRVAPERAHHQGNRREHAEIDQAEDHRTHHVVQQHAELHPGPVEGREPVRTDHGHQRGGRGEGQHPGLEKQGDQREKAGEGPAERAVGRQYGFHWMATLTCAMRGAVDGRRSEGTMGAEAAAGSSAPYSCQLLICSSASGFFDIASMKRLASCTSVMSGMPKSALLRRMR